MAKPAAKPKVEAFPADQNPTGPGDNSVTPEQLKLEDVFLRLTKGIVQ